MKRERIFTRLHAVKLRLLSILLVFVLLAAGVQLCIPVWAADDGSTAGAVNAKGRRTDDSKLFPDEEIPFELPLLPGDLSPEEIADAELDMTTVPAVITAENIAEQHHVKRLYEQEPDDYTIIFQNRDLSKTTYIFSYPVKGNTGINAAEIGRVGTSDTMTVGNSAGSIVLENEALSRRLGNPDIPGGLMPYNIGSCVIKQLTPSGEEIMSGGAAQQGIDVLDAVRKVAAAHAAEPDAEMSADIALSAEDADLAAAVSGGAAYLMMNTSDIAGDYIIKNKAYKNYLTNINNYSVGVGSAPSLSARWLITAAGGNRFTIRSQSEQTLYLVEESQHSIELVDCDGIYDGNDEWVIDYDTTSGGVSFWSIQSYNNYYLGIYNNRILISEMADYPEDDYLWGLTNKINSIDVEEVEFDSYIDAVVGDYVDISEHVTFYPSNATYRNIEVKLVNSSILEEVEENYYYDVVGVGVNRLILSYACNSEISAAYCAVVCSTGTVDIQSAYTYMMRAYNDSSKLLTFNVDGSDLDSTWLSMSSINETWDTLSQSFTLTRAYRGAYRITSTLTTEQYEAPAYNGRGVMSGEYYLADEKTKNNTLALSGSSLTLTTYSASNAYRYWYIVKNGSSYSFINAGNPGYALRLSASSVTVGSYSSSSADFKWNTTFLGVNVPLIKQCANNYCGPTSVLQVLYGMNFDCSIFGDDLIEQMSTMAGYMNLTPGGNGASYADIHEKLNNYLELDAQGNCYKPRWPGTDSTVALDCISDSLSSGYPSILYFQGRLPNYNSFADHYVAIVGCDYESGLVVYSDCNYNSAYFGIHTAYIDEIYDSVSHWIVFRYLES